MAKKKKSAIKNPEPPSFEIERQRMAALTSPLTPPEAAREWRLLRTAIPSASNDPGRRRTPYFYRREAIGWLQNARCAWSDEMRETFIRLAKAYQATYRKMKGLAA